MPELPQVEKLFRIVADREASRFVSEGKLFEKGKQGLARGMLGLDFVPLPTDLFEPGARRIYINVTEAEGAHEAFRFLSTNPAAWTPAQRAVGDGDAKEYHSKKGDPMTHGWSLSADAGWLRGFLDSIPLYEESAWTTDEWTKLEQELSDEHSSCKGVVVRFPVAMILATKKTNEAKKHTAGDTDPDLLENGIHLGGGELTHPVEPYPRVDDTSA